MKPQPRRAGLTLIELVVTLAILVALTTVAIRATEGSIQQARFEATQRQLTEIELAVLGPANSREPDGTPRVTGFVADLGAVPDTLDDLVVPGAWPSLTIGTTSFDSEVVIAAGWHGPYLRLAPGEDAVEDGWRRPFFRLPETGTLDAIWSGGANGTLDLEVTDSPFDLDVGIDLSSTRYTNDLIVRVSDQSSGQDPDPVNNGGIIVALFGPEDGAPSFALFEVDASPFTATVPSTIGPRALRAYQHAGLTGSSTSGDGASRKSPIVRVVVTPTGTQTIELVLQGP